MDQHRDQGMFPLLKPGNIQDKLASASLLDLLIDFKIEQMMVKYTQ